MIACLLDGSSIRAETSKIAFWERAPHGANMFSENPDSDFDRAFKSGIRLVRFGAVGANNDFRFLVKGELPNDEWDLSVKNLERLKNSVRRAKIHGLRVVISLAHLPGRSHEFRKRDFRIWQEAKYQTEFINAWSLIADTLKDMDAVVGYDLMNEPYLPKASSSNSPLIALYQKTIKAIRSVDPKTPIILESPDMASAEEVPSMMAIDDRAVIYSFHYYEPFPYFSPPLNQGKWIYPGMIPSSEDETPSLWNIDTHKKRFQPIRDWQISNNIESYRIYVGEFGAWRRANGAETYLKDLLSIFDDYGWAWTYYAFREDGWDVADLEKVDGSPERIETNLFRLIKSYFK